MFLLTKDLFYILLERSVVCYKTVMSKSLQRWDHSDHVRHFYGIENRVSREMSNFGSTRRIKVIDAGYRHQSPFESVQL